jgi:AcrR family transcriptional regulator
MARRKYNVDTPERILAASARLVAKHGYRTLTLKDVSGEAKVDGAAVNYHFGGKARLYHATVEYCLKIRESAAPLDEQGWRPLPPEQRLRNFIATIVEQLLNDRAASSLSQIMLWEAIEPTTRFNELVRKLPARQLRFLDELVLDWVGPAFPKRKVRAASISILGQCVYYRYGRKILEKIERRKRTSALEIGKIADEIFEFSAAALHGIAAMQPGRKLSPAKNRQRICEESS